MVSGKGIEGGEGTGFLLVVCDVTDVVRKGEPNRLVVWANNEISEAALPCGTVKTTVSERRLIKKRVRRGHCTGNEKFAVHVLF